MREILFRGKRCDNLDWVEGYLLKECNYATCSWNLGIEYKTDRFGRFAYEVAEVVPYTVGQYTGLTANGKRIFEGDIVTGLFLFERSVRGVVAFRGGSFGVKWMRGNVDEFNAFTSCCNVKWAVIGNVADNPELLEGGVNDG